jgi:hypothetical protein
MISHEVLDLLHAEERPDILQIFEFKALVEKELAGK